MLIGLVLTTATTLATEAVTLGWRVLPHPVRDIITDGIAAAECL